jgi:hypothetical protein
MGPLTRRTISDVRTKATMTEGPKLRAIFGL